MDYFVIDISWYMSEVLKKLLAVDSSRTIANIAIAEVENNPELFSEAWVILMNDKYPLSMRAARIIDECAEKNPALIKPYINEMILHLKSFNTDGVKRSLLRYIQRARPKLNNKQKGLLVDTCFEFLTAASSSIAIRYYSLLILYDISQKEKSLKQELINALDICILQNKIRPNSISDKIRKKLQKEIVP